MIALHDRSEPDLRRAGSSDSMPIPVAMLLATALSVPAWAVIGWLVLSVG